jgi:hypothetical protein
MTVGSENKLFSRLPPRLASASASALLLGASVGTYGLEVQGVGHRRRLYGRRGHDPGPTHRFGGKRRGVNHYFCTT